MPARNKWFVTLPSFVVDPRSVVNNDGRQVDWDAIVVATDTDFVDGNGDRVIKPGTVVAQKGGKIIPRAVAAAAIDAGASISVTGGVATVTSTAHGLTPGDWVEVAGATPTALNGVFQVLTAADANTFTYATTAGDGAATGTITIDAAAIGLLVSDAHEKDKSHSLSGYGVYIGGVFYANLLPDATGTPKQLPAGYRTELAATGFAYTFQQYADTRTN